MSQVSKASSVKFVELDCQQERSGRYRWMLHPVVLIVIGFVPALLTFFACQLELFPKVTYPLSKLFVFLLPVFIWRIQKKSMSEVRAVCGAKGKNGAIGLLTGILFASVILVGYYLCLVDHIDGAAIAGKLERTGVIKYYLALAMFITIWNSFIEEYFWRGFYFSSLKNHFGNAFAILLSGLCFGLHHWFILESYFPIQLVLLFIAGTILAGWVWAWQRSRGISIWQCYISHMFADAAVLWVGWLLISV